MMEYCRLEPEMNENDIGPIFITTVDRLLGHLFDYRQVRISGDCVENGMSRTVELLVIDNCHVGVENVCLEILQRNQPTRSLHSIRVQVVRFASIVK
jgi:hypothetical protein